MLFPHAAIRAATCGTMLFARGGAGGRRPNAFLGTLSGLAAHTRPEASGLETSSLTVGEELFSVRPRYPGVPADFYNRGSLSLSDMLGTSLSTYCLEDAKSEEESRKKKKKLRRTWEEKFALLRLYKKMHGNCDPPKGYVTPCGIRLGGWAATQRKEYRKLASGFGFSDILNERRISRLEAVGFQWNTEQVENGAWNVAVKLAAMMIQTCSSGLGVSFQGKSTFGSSVWA